MYREIEKSMGFYIHKSTIYSIKVCSMEVMVDPILKKYMQVWDCRIGKLLAHTATNRGTYTFKSASTHGIEI